MLVSFLLVAIYIVVKSKSKISVANRLFFYSFLRYLPYGMILAYFLLHSLHLYFWNLSLSNILVCWKKMSDIQRLSIFNFLQIIWTLVSFSFFCNFSVDVFFLVLFKVLSQIIFIGPQIIYCFVTTLLVRVFKEHISWNMIKKKEIDEDISLNNSLEKCIVIV